MDWVIQRNLLNPLTFKALQSALSVRGINSTAVNHIPFLNVLSPDVDVLAESVFAYGSTGLCEVARAKGWTPGYYDENLDYALYLKHYGTEMLNHDAVVTTLGQLEKRWDLFFLRPSSDAKQFAGEVMSWAELEKFRAGVMSVENDEGVTLTVRDTVVMAPCKGIFAEYRFFVINGQVVAGTRYKVGDQVRASTVIPPEVLRYVRAQVDRWQPNRAFAIDIAETEQGLCIIELNSANSAGFYACDLGLIVEAVALL